MAEKNIVIVGAGFGGVFAAKTLSKKLKSHKEYNIILIDKHSYFTYMTELHEVASQRVAPKHVQEDLEHLFYQNKNVKLLTAEVNGINKNDKTNYQNSGKYRNSFFYQIFQNRATAILKA